MSKIALEGNASGTGTLTIAAPNTSTDRTLTLPDEAGTIITSASSISGSQIPNASITNAKLENGYPNLDFVNPVNLSAQNMASSGWYNLGSIAIPSSGNWLVTASLRFGWLDIDGYSKIKLSTSSSTAGIFGYDKFIVERVKTTNNNSNSTFFHSFIVQIGTGATFPYSVYLLGYVSVNSTFYLQNDGNGYNALGAVKLGSTTSTGSSAVQLGY